ncbi:MAG TPA: hypothetical protein VIO60_00845, partial [Rectinemataceae bacterium]
PFAASSLTYGIGGKLFTRRYSGLSGSGTDASPVYENRWIAWDSGSLTSHALSMNLSRKKKELSQLFGFSANIPPLAEKYSASYSLNSAMVKAGIHGAVSRASPSADLAPSSLTASFTLGASPYPVMRTDLSWDFAANDFSSAVGSLEYAWAKAAFTAKKSKGYTLSLGEWSADGTDYFRPYEASISFSPRIVLGGASPAGSSAKAQNGAIAEPEPQEPQAEDLEGGQTGDRAGEQEREKADLQAEEQEPPSATAGSIKLSLNPKLSYTQNFIRFTEATITASLDLSLQSEQGTALGFSASSSNKSAWRYWPGLFPSSPSFDPADYYKSIFIDLGESFSVWDSAALRRSLFKLRNLSLKLSQDLHDWDLSASLSMSPYLVTPDAGRPYYQLDFSFSLGLTWKDIPELKAKASYTKGAFEE